MRREQDVLLKIRDAQTYFPVQKGLFKRTVGYVRAVDNVSLDVYRGDFGAGGRKRLRQDHLGQVHPAAGTRNRGQFIYNFDGKKRICASSPKTR